MEKPINKFAVALWAIAIVYAAVEGWSLYAVLYPAHDLQGGNADLDTNGIWKIVVSLVLVCGTLIALGFLIEMLDQTSRDDTNRDK